MRSGGQTTVIQRVLERRANQPPALEEDTTSTIAVMLRVLPPPRAVLAIGDSVLRGQIEHRLAADLLDLEHAADDAEALQLFESEFRPVVLTDSPELIRKLRARQGDRAPYIVYFSELDETDEREIGLIAGADECVARRTSDRELHARISALETAIADRREVYNDAVTAQNVRIEAFPDAMIASWFGFSAGRLLKFNAEQTSDVDVKLAFGR